LREILQMGGRICAPRRGAGEIGNLLSSRLSPEADLADPEGGCRGKDEQSPAEEVIKPQVEGKFFGCEPLNLCSVGQGENVLRHSGSVLGGYHYIVRMLGPALEPGWPNRCRECRSGSLALSSLRQGFGYAQSDGLSGKVDQVAADFGSDSVDCDGVLVEVNQAGGRYDGHWARAR